MKKEVSETTPTITDLGEDSKLWLTKKTRNSDSLTSEFHSECKNTTSEIPLKLNFTLHRLTKVILNTTLRLTTRLFSTFLQLLKNQFLGQLGLPRLPNSDPTSIFRFESLK